MRPQLRLLRAGGRSRPPPDLPRATRRTDLVLRRVHLHRGTARRNGCPVEVALRGNGPSSHPRPTKTIVQ